MEIYVKRSDLGCYLDRGLTRQGKLHIVRGTTEPVKVYFMSGTATVDLGAGATGTFSAKLADDYGSTQKLFAANSWTKATDGDDEYYNFSVTWLSAQGDAALADCEVDGDAAYIDLMCQVNFTTSDGAARTLAFLVRYWNSVDSGADTAPDDLNGKTSVATMTDVPASETDFTMFPGSVAPTSGLYLEGDGKHLYVFKGGWTKWRRVAIALWES